MNYVAAISIDFGSTNTGCAGIHSSENGGKIEYRTPEFFYHTGNYAKDNTWFFVKPDFFAKIKNDFKGVRDEDFSIESIVSHPDNPNIIWGRKPIKQFSSLIKTEGWIQFRWLKMDFLHGTSYSSDCLSIEQAIKLFFRILKIERLKAESARLKRKVSADEILWGVTIPSVLSTEQKQIMLSVVKDILSPDARILSEPEGPMVSSFVHGGKSFDGYQDGRVSLVIDCGGGTTDICLMQENTKGKKPIVDMIAHTEGSVAGGNDVDNAFYIYFLRKILPNGVEIFSKTEGSTFYFQSPLPYLCTCTITVDAKRKDLVEERKSERQMKIETSRKFLDCTIIAYSFLRNGYKYSLANVFRKMEIAYKNGTAFREIPMKEEYGLSMLLASGFLQGCAAKHESGR